jgi:hypothetical protein
VATFEQGRERKEVRFNNTSQGDHCGDTSEQRQR